MPSARASAARPPTTGRSRADPVRSTVSRVPGSGWRVKSASLEKIISPRRWPAGMIWSSGWRSKATSTNSPGTSGALSRIEAAFCGSAQPRVTRLSLMGASSVQGRGHQPDREVGGGAVGGEAEGDAGEAGEVHVFGQLGRRVEQTVLRGFRPGQVGAGEAHVVGERLLPGGGIGLERQHTPRTSVAGRMQPHGLRARVGVGRVGRRAQPVVVLARDPRSGVAFNAVLDPVQVPGKPAVHQAERRLAPVASLVVVDLHRHAAVAQRGHDAVAVLGHHVPVVEAVRHERGGRARRRCG